MKNAGMTLIEVSVAVAIFTTLMAVLMSVALSFSETAEVQSAVIGTSGEARGALMRLGPKVRQAQKMSINWNKLPGDVLQFQMAVDKDGNGTASDAKGKIELSSVVTIQPDFQDANGDGKKETQLVMIQDGVVTVLANQLATNNEGVGQGGVFGPANDLNGNGRMDRGFWVSSQDGGISIRIQTQEHSRRGHSYDTVLSEFIQPRN